MKFIYYLIPFIVCCSPTEQEQIQKKQDSVKVTTIDVMLGEKKCKVHFIDVIEERTTRVVECDNKIYSSQSIDASHSSHGSTRSTDTSTIVINNTDGK